MGSSIDHLINHICECINFLAISQLNVLTSQLFSKFPMMSEQLYSILLNNQASK